MHAIADALIRAVDLQRAGRVGAAEALYADILAHAPGEPRALYLYGLLHLGAGRAGPAALLLSAAAAARPGHSGARLALARARLIAGEPAAALAASEAALVLEPEAAEAHFLRGTALNALARAGEAIAPLERAITLDPSHAAAHLNLANACADLDRLDEAERRCRAAIDRDPALGEAQVSLGFILTSLGRLAEGIAACEAAIRLRPDFAQAHWNRATACLLAGDFANGFAEYEWRKRHDRYRRDYVDLPGPVWRGESLAGRRILVKAEQGLGDTIQFARYIPLLAASGAQVALACNPTLFPLLRTLPGLAALAPGRSPFPDHDVWVDQMSLPRLFGTAPDTIPAASGYLAADPARVARWRARLGARSCPVGLVWAGNPAHSNDRRRSLPPAALAALLAIPGADFLSLQVGPRSGEAARIAGVPDLSADLTDYAETAALITALDLVITVDTSVAHLAGALGKPAWVMLPFAPDWRWILGRDDTPWYLSLRLFRQPRPGDWASVVKAVRIAFTNR